MSAAPHLVAVSSTTPVAAAPTGGAVNTVASQSHIGHKLKVIHTAARDGVIIMQDENGPCPLLAIINVLIIRGKINIHPDYSRISNEQLIGYIGEFLLASKPVLKTAEEQASYERNVADAIALLPRLQHGIDVNIRFGGPAEFEFTPECLVFDLLGIKLRHGWVADREPAEAYELLRKLSYNQAVERLIAARSGSPSSTTEAQRMQHEAALIERFLNESSSQLTWTGLTELHRDLAEGESVALFRNNHFATLVKVKGELYTLCTDVGFFQEPFMIWEKLSAIDGDSSFFDADFRAAGVATPLPPSIPLPPVAAQPSVAKHTSTVDSDLQLAQQLHNEEVQRAQQLQPQQQQRSTATEGKSKHKQHRKQKSDDDCRLL